MLEKLQFCGAIVGSCLGFLWYNAPPAKIFMGDTGSLSLGGSLAAVAIIVKHGNSSCDYRGAFCFRNDFCYYPSYIV